MVDFNELRVSEDGKSLIIDASVKDLSYYSNVFIDSVVIDTHNTFSEAGPSDSPIFIYDAADSPSAVWTECVKANTEDKVCYTDGDGEKRVRLELDTTALGVSISNTLFFVYVTCTGTPAIDTPCGMDSSITMGVALDMHPLYLTMMSKAREMENNCGQSRGFIDTLLRFKALEISLRTGHYTQAIAYWNKWFMETKVQSSNTCGCG